MLFEFTFATPKKKEAHLFYSHKHQHKPQNTGLSVRRSLSVIGHTTAAAKLLLNIALSLQSTWISEKYQANKNRQTGVCRQTNGRIDRATVCGCLDNRGGAAHWTLSADGE